MLRYINGMASFFDLWAVGFNKSSGANRDVWSSESPPASGVICASEVDGEGMKIGLCLGRMKTQPIACWR